MQKVVVLAIVAALRRRWNYGFSERTAPELRCSIEVIGVAVDDQRRQAASMHRSPPAVVDPLGRCAQAVYMFSRERCAWVTGETAILRGRLCSSHPVFMASKHGSVPSAEGGAHHAACRQRFEDRCCHDFHSLAFRES